MVMKISTKGIKPKYVHLNEFTSQMLQMVAGGIQIQTGHLIENFLFGIFETCFQSFLKTF